MTKDDKEIVSAVQAALAGRVGQQRYAVWFGRGVRFESSGSTLRLAVADAFRLEYLRRAFRAEILAALRSVAGEGWTLDFCVDAAASAVVPVKEPDAASDQPHAELVPAVVPLAASISQESRPARPESSNGAGPRPPKRSFARLNDFLAGEANRVALTAAETAAKRPGTYTPLTFVGPPGCGKTHLLEGIWRHVRESRTLSRAIYLTAEQFTNQFLEALRHGGTPSFRRKYRDVELLLIDDVQFFAGKQSTIVEVVHTVDQLVREGRQVAFAADRPPAELRGLGPELAARLASGLVCHLEPADFSSRLGILNALVTRNAFSPPAEVLSWMAGQFEGDARHLSGALNRLQAASEAHQRDIDLDFAQQALDDLLQASKRPVRLPEIVDAVCEVFGVERQELESGSKTASVVLPRMLVMFLARKWTRAALSEISKTLGRRSHSTVVSAQHKVTAWLAEGKTVPLLHGQCRVEEAIKRVEAQLRLA